MRGLNLDKDGKLGVSEAEVQQACIQFAGLYGYDYVATNASNLTRAGHPAHDVGTLDGLLIHPFQGTIIVEWKRRMAKTDKKRLKAQAEMEAYWAAKKYTVIRMPEAGRDPIQWFKDRFVLATRED